MNPKTGLLAAFYTLPQELHIRPSDLSPEDWIEFTYYREVDCTSREEYAEMAASIST